eukprot:SAG11_NODE_9023_length_952_cov_1.381008_2_plen_144_part_01
MELEQQMVEHRIEVRNKADIIAKVETEIESMRAQMWEAKDHYEQLIAQVQAKCAKTVCDAQQQASTLRLKLEQALAENRTMSAKLEKGKVRHVRELDELAIKQKQELYIQQRQFEALHGRSAGSVRPSSSRKPALADRKHPSR